MRSYQFDAKALYRARRDAAIDAYCKVPKRLRRVAYLDTKEGLDTRYRLATGYSAENLYPVNDNPAHVALLTMGLRAAGLPDVNTVGLDFHEAFRRGRIPHDVDVIDFDGMSQLHAHTGPMVHQLLATSFATRPRVVFAMTLLAGREQGLYRSLLRHHIKCHTGATSYGQEVSDEHIARVNLALFAGGATYGDDGARTGCGAHVVDVKWDRYVSDSRQAMVWFVALMKRHTDAESKRLNDAASRGENPLPMRVLRLAAIPHCMNLQAAMNGSAVNMTQAVSRNTHNFLEAKANKGERKVFRSGLW